ncbi:Mu-like prophage major head subunit gpT family protein [Sphingobium sp. AS12]|uniref:prohead protease/major capsid protein fusion protein n=1 Tax=Sphingobium sp. AS12 TaxID=2849495 RepID=UPI001C312339|nr:prohead protease/major capsid protein fusion protein [Sphingobium sp. AS12]MBV2148612.1 Mu-like prophage major head subunit gpT family protein [Sphingobium sp. AS12]
MPQTQVNPAQTVAPMMYRAAATQPSSYDEADNSIEICWTTGAAGLRFDWWDGEYYIEELSLDRSAVRLDRLNNGACLLDSHNDYTLRSVLGSVVPGSVKIGEGQGVARVRLAKTPDVADTNQKIIDGHIRSVSVGYMVHTYLRTEKQGEKPHMLATDWEPIELSMVAVPFDAGAQVRARKAEQGGHPCIIRGAPATIEEVDMPEPIAPAPAPAPAPVTIPESDVRAGEVTLKRMMDLFGRSSLSPEQRTAILSRHAETPMTEEQLTDAITDAYVADRAQPQITGTITISADEQDKYRNAMRGAFVVRMANSFETPADGGELFGHMGTLEIARQYLERSGVRTATMSPYQLCQEALGFRHGAMTTSDFAIALQQAGNLVIMTEYEAATENWKLLSKETSANDFRPTPIVGLVGAAEFQIVAENGEYTYGSFQDIGDSYKLWTAGKIYSLSRQLIINDQLGLFSDISSKLGTGAALHEANAAWANIIGNPILSDGYALFSSQHGNLAGAGAAITTGSLGVARAAMRKQKDRDGVTVINLVPKYLVVGPDKETEAEGVLTAVAATTSGNVNLFANKLTLVVEPRITDNRWMLFAEPSRAPVVQHAYLKGQRGVYTETRVGFEVDGVEYKGRTDFNAKAIDYRGAYMNPGA